VSPPAGAIPPVGEIRAAGGIAPVGEIPPAGEIHVWHVTLAGTPELLRSGAVLLDAGELARARRLVLEADRARFVLSHVALRCVLATALGRAPREIALAAGPHGKPGLAPGQDGGLRWNLSHSGRLALVAVARDVEVGADVERVRPWPDDDRVLPLDLLASRARRRLAALPAAARPREFARCWTRVEAVAKALGTGLAAGGWEAAVAGDGCRLAELPAPDGYAASVAWCGGPRRLVSLGCTVAALAAGHVDGRPARDVAALAAGQAEGRPAPAGSACAGAAPAGSACAGAAPAGAAPAAAALPG
jgi:phosphopantetheinyl transferase